MAPPGEYTKPVTTTISLGNTPASDGEDKALPTASETHTAQALEAITVVPVKRTGEVAAMTDEAAREPGLLQNNKWKPPSRAGRIQKEERDQMLNPKPRLSTT